jgi:hypothetical protein
VGLPERYDPLATPPYIDFLVDKQAGGLYRSLSFDALPMPNFAMPYGLSNFSWILPLISKESVAFTKRYLDAGFLTINWYAANVAVARNDGAGSALSELGRNLKYYSLIGARYVVAGGTAIDLPQVFADERTGAKVYLNEKALPRLFLAPCSRVVPEGKAALADLGGISDPRVEVLVDRGPELACPGAKPEARLTISRFDLSPNEVKARFTSDRAGIVTLTDLHAPGWRAFLDGEETEILKVDGIFRGVRADRTGEHELRFVYRPPRWNLSLILACAGLLLCLYLADLVSVFLRGTPELSWGTQRPSRDSRRTGVSLPHVFRESQ